MLKYFKLKRQLKKELKKIETETEKAREASKKSFQENVDKLSVEQLLILNELFKDDIERHKGKK